MFLLCKCAFVRVCNNIYVPVVSSGTIPIIDCGNN